jgi:Fusaric acid resistance protein-like
LATISTPSAFVGATMAIAAASILVTAKGHKLRPLGNFTFIPALYLACEAAEGTPRGALLDRGLAFLPYMAAALVPVIVMATAEHVRDRDLGVSHIRHLTSFRRRVVDHGVATSFVEAMLAVALAVACASSIVEWHHLDHGQWVIWSAASVVTGDAASARRKLGDRIIRAFVGVPIGVTSGFLMPHNGIVLELATIGAVLSLVAFRRYPLGFGLRCALIALTIIDTDQSMAFAVERVGNVVLGGVIGLAFVFGVRGLALIRQRGRQRDSGPIDMGTFTTLATSDSLVGLEVQLSIILEDAGSENRSRASAHRAHSIHGREIQLGSKHCRPLSLNRRRYVGGDRQRFRAEPVGGELANLA